MNAPIQITEPNTPQVAADQIDFVDLYRRWEQGNWSAMDIDFTQDKVDWNERFDDFGLAAARYLHFTSPIRRYADLVVHRAVKRFLAGTRGATTADPALEALAVEINRAAYAARRAEIERLQMVAARWLAPRIGERFRGNVVATKSFGVVVQLEGMGVTGTIASEGLPPGGLPLGVPLDVKLVRVDEELGRIDLERA